MNNCDTTSISVIIISYYILFRSNQKCSLEDNINNRILPAEGFPALQAAARKQLEWAATIPALIPIDESIYRKLMAVIFASLYVLVPQGRVEAFTTLPLDEVVSLIVDGLPGDSESSLAPYVVLSNTFKTRSRYGYQPVSLPAEMRPVLLIYLEMRKRKHTAAEVFFVDYHGVGYTSTAVGHLVTQFFRTALGIHINTTNIRSLAEIMAKKAHDAGVITNVQRDAVQHINGHSSATTTDYYLRQSRMQDAINGQAAFEALVRENDRLPLVTHPERTLNNSQWGTEHPHRELSGERVPWSAFELNFVGTFCSDLLHREPNQTYTVVRSCLAHIKSDHNLIAKFHKHHTLDGSRLSYAWKKWKNDERKGGMIEEFELCSQTRVI